MIMEHINASDKSKFRAIFAFTTRLIYVIYWQAHFGSNYCNIQGGSNMTGTDFFFCNHNCSSL